MNENLKTQLEQLREAAPLDEASVAEERAKFLAQAAEFRTARFSFVSWTPNRRHIRWINALVFVFQRKEPVMLNFLIAMIITISLVFGGAGATAYASQSSLPDELLYPVKTWGENIRLSLAGSAEEQLALTLNFTARRVDEIASLQAGARPVSDAVERRLQQELDAALQIAAGMDDVQMVTALAQIRQHAESQAQTVGDLANKASGQAAAKDASLLGRIQNRLQEQARLASAGAADPQAFRQQVGGALNHQSTQTAHPTAQATHTPMSTSHPTDDEQETETVVWSATPTPSETGAPDPSRTPMSPGGPGPHPSGTPMHGGGPGPGDGTPRSTPDASGTPMHDGGPGPGPGDGTPRSTP